MVIGAHFKDKRDFRERSNSPAGESVYSSEKRMDFSAFENYEVEGQISFFDEEQEQKPMEQEDKSDFPEVMP